MNIKVSHAYANEYYAVDDDTYDGPGSAIGSGATPAAAVNDLVSQIVDDLETRIDRWVSREWQQRMEVMRLKEEAHQNYVHY